MELSSPIQSAKKIKETPEMAKRARWAWYLYDFGNSAYAAVILLAVYSAYFKGTVVGGARGSWLWGLSIGIAMLIVTVLSPILGTIADFVAAKKRFLFVFTALSVTATSLLFFVEAGDILSGMIFFIIAEVGYRAAQVFYDALLPEISSQEDMAKVSGNGWAIGSAGGVVCLLIVLPLIILFKGALMVRVSMIITAVFYALSSIPLFLWVKEKAEPQALPAGENYLSLAYKRLSTTIKSTRQFRQFIRFIIAFLVYNDGILMILDFAAIIGAVLFGMNQQQLIILMIIVQVTSIGGAFLFGIIADRLGSKRAIVYSLVMMLVTVCSLVFIQSLVGFYLLAAVAGFALTGVQSVSRTMVGQISPEGKSGEFYGLFSVAGRTSSFIGPTVYGWVAVGAANYFHSVGQTLHVAEQSGQRAAVLSAAAFLVVGLILLFFVKDASRNKKETA
ncbi:MFS transporter [Ornatilinea apprima]|nr:MFS transporter [Ornatilinea apprima]